MNKRLLIGLGVVGVLTLLVSGCQDRPTAEEIVARMREVEASIENAHAVVEFSLRSPAKEMDLTVEMWEQSPNKFRAEVLEASEENLAGMVSVTDGQQVWIYSPGENEALVGRVGEFGVDEPLNPRQVIDLMQEGIQRVMDTCDVELVGEEEVDGAATYKLEFTPREGEEAALPIPVSKGTLWVEQERWIALQAQFEGGTMGEGWMRVRSFEFNTGVDDGRFQFQVPADAHVTNVEDVQPTPLTLDEARAQAGFTLLVPSHVPDGTTLTDVFTASGAFILHYDHSIVSFTITQRLLQEGEELEQMIEERFSQEAQTRVTVRDQTVRGQAAVLVTDDQDNSLLTWTEDGTVITIAGRIGQDELLKVAESLQ